MSIADQLAAIKANVPLVYKAGYDKGKSEGGGSGGGSVETCTVVIDHYISNWMCVYTAFEDGATTLKTLTLRQSSLTLQDVVCSSLLYLTNSGMWNYSMVSDNMMKSTIGGCVMAPRDAGEIGTVTIIYD
jgi:hypothetical protein